MPVPSPFRRHNYHQEGCFCCERSVTQESSGTQRCKGPVLVRISGVFKQSNGIMTNKQEARNRRMREAPAAAPADPSRATDMDNASFVATLPPELRREILLSADETVLNTLPPNLVAEAMVLRERIPHQVGLKFWVVLGVVLS